MDMWYIIVIVAVIAKLFLIFCCIMVRMRNRQEAIRVAQQNAYVQGRNVSVVVQPRYIGAQPVFGSRTPIIPHEELPANVYVPNANGTQQPPAYDQIAGLQNPPSNAAEATAPPPKYDEVAANQYYYNYNQVPRSDPSNV